jgi:hypothetical protein
MLWVRQHGFMVGLVLCFLAALAGGLGWFFKSGLFTGLAVAGGIAGLVLVFCGEDPEEQAQAERQRRL